MPHLSAMVRIFEAMRTAYRSTSSATPASTFPWCSPERTGRAGHFGCVDSASAAHGQSHTHAHACACARACTQGSVSKSTCPEVEEALRAMSAFNKNGGASPCQHNSHSSQCGAVCFGCWPDCSGGGSSSAVKLAACSTLPD